MDKPPGNDFGNPCILVTTSAPRGDQRANRRAKGLTDKVICRGHFSPKM